MEQQVLCCYKPSAMLVVLALFFAMPAFADEIPVPEIQLPEIKTEYGEGDSAKYYKWEEDADAKGDYKFVETTESDAQITAKYDTSKLQTRYDSTKDPEREFDGGSFVGLSTGSTALKEYGGAIYNDGDFESITADFVGNYVNSTTSSSSTSISSYGGAVYNEGTIDSINGNFIGNYAAGYMSSSSSKYVYANGGAIYNGYSAKIDSITGNFIGNYVTNTGNKGSIVLNGGAIYNDERAAIESIIGDFVGNHAYTQVGKANGGAIYNTGIASSSGYGYATISDIAGNFIGNYVSASSTQGGAIYNDGVINSITGDFVGNYSSAKGIAYGGAIFQKNGSINSITGDFIGNYASGTSAYGGAIYNTQKIGNINGNFIGNNAAAHAFTDDALSYGGAINNYGNGTINSITGDFIGNYVSASSDFSTKASNAYGGAIYNEGTIDSINGNFRGNYVSDAKRVYGGAIWNLRNIGSITGDFVGNYAISPTYDARGGAIFNEGTIDTISGSFIGNYAKGKTAFGGAIYTTKDLNIVADNSQSIFSGNYIEVKEEKVPEAIFVDSSKAILTLKSQNNGQILFDDQINGKKGYILALTGDESGKIYLNNSVINANVTSEEVKLNLGKKDVFENSDFTITSGTLGFVNGIAEQQIMQSANITGNINLALDVDLATEQMDTLPDNTKVNPGAQINVNYLNILNEANQNETKIAFAPESYANQVQYTGQSPIAYSPIWKYDVDYTIDEKDNTGFFTFTRGSTGTYTDYNPAVTAPSVATQAGAYTTQLQTFNYAFQHADTFMNIPYLERLSIIKNNKYALSPTADATDVGTFSPLLTKEKDPGFWIKPYASFENIPLKNGPKVSNISYGTLVGYDSALTSIKHGWERVLTGYVGYNGASQRYSGVDSYQNGGILGGTTTLYKGNFFNATTISVGASAGDSTTMYGKEDYTMLLAGIGNKTGYNLEFKEGRIILQPSMLISYTFVNTFDYTNASGLRIKSDPLNAIQLAPGIKLIGNTKNGWQPYASVSMVWNLLDDSKVTANDTRLPEMSIKPYVQYGVGVQKLIQKRFVAYGQAMVHNGGRNGISLTAGFRWKVGRD